MEKKGIRFVKELFLVLILAFGLVSATACATGAPAPSGGSGSINYVMCQICLLVSGLVPIIAFVLFVLAGVTYALGNFFGAEMRAKAIGYSMNMLVGAIVALLLTIIGPIILSAMVPSGSAFASSSATCGSISW